MNLKSRNTKTVEEASSEDLLGDAFADIDAIQNDISSEISLMDVDTSDLDLCEEVKDFVDALPSSKNKSETCEEKPKKKATKKAQKTASGVAETFKEIRLANQKEFESLLNEFENKVREEDVSSFEVPFKKAFLKSKFEAEGFTVEETEKGLKIAF